VRVDLHSSSPITKVFAPALFKQVDHGLSEMAYHVSLRVESPKDIGEERDINIYYQQAESGNPQIFAMKTPEGETALMIQVMPTFD
jgi:hypothetical protein